jgi:Xaa-Pro dipeptidase
MKARSERIFASLDASVSVDAIAIPERQRELRGQYVPLRVRRLLGSGGYEGCAAVLFRGERPRLVVSRLEERARAPRRMRRSSFPTQAAFRDVLKAALGGARRIGVNGRACRGRRVRTMQELLPEAEIVDVGDALVRARLVKDKDEATRIRRACAIASAVADEIPSMLRAGMTERELAGSIDHGITAARLHRRLPDDRRVRRRCRRSPLLARRRRASARRLRPRGLRREAGRLLLGHRARSSSAPPPQAALHVRRGAARSS